MKPAQCAIAHAIAYDEVLSSYDFMIGWLQSLQYAIGLYMHNFSTILRIHNVMYSWNNMHMSLYAKKLIHVCSVTITIAWDFWQFETTI